MADTTSTTVQGPVTVRNDSAERVALDLYFQIRDMPPERQDKELALFARCLWHAREPQRTIKEVKDRVRGA